MSTDAPKAGGLFGAPLARRPEEAARQGYSASSQGNGSPSTSSIRSTLSRSPSAADAAIINSPHNSISARATWS
ncbi:hypothetical protein [Streptomyces sp. NPDC050504]|uniref:hypothetical protein n=1 Tax=Streptomyces sp. NPDC050504 TaxID=3365618 RepID=UPI0037B7D016